MILDAQSATAASGTGQAAADKRKLDTDLNRFLTLLVSQLQNQDPLEPLDANQFTSQLVQFASVEQQIYQNANLEKLLSAQQGAELASTVGYLGKQVEASGDALPLQGGNAFASYTLPQTASRATITIMDATGKTVAALPANTAAGRHELHWDGRATDGTKLPDGVYAFKLDAKDKSGDAVSPRARDGSDKRSERHAIEPRRHACADGGRALDQGGHGRVVGGLTRRRWQ